MSTTRKFTIGFAAVGFVIGFTLFVLVEKQHSVETPPIEAVLSFLCPPSVLSIVLFTPRTSVGLQIAAEVVWLIIVLLNALIYGAVGFAIDKILGKIKQIP
jgi:hypothetical protein